MKSFKHLQKLIYNSNFVIKNFKSFSKRNDFLFDSDIKKKLQDKWDIKTGLKKDDSNPMMNFNFDVYFLF